MSRLRTRKTVCPRIQAQYMTTCVFSMLTGTAFPSWDVLPSLPPLCNSYASFTSHSVLTSSEEAFLRFPLHPFSGLGAHPP